MIGSLLFSTQTQVVARALTANPVVQTAITSTEPKQVTGNPTPCFIIDFGERVVQLDPLTLFTIEGTSATDVVYDVNAGRVTIQAHLPEGVAADVTVTVAAGAATDIVGNACTAAALTLLYRPTSPAATSARAVTNTVVGGSVVVAATVPIAIAALLPANAVAGNCNELS